MHTFSRFLTIACMAAFSSAFAQRQTALPVISLGAAREGKVSVESIIKDPVLHPIIEGCRVKEHTVAYVSNDGKVHGPYGIAGNTIIPELIAYFQKNKGVEMRILVENIKCSCSGRDTVFAPVVFRIM